MSKNKKLTPLVLGGLIVVVLFLPTVNKSLGASCVLTGGSFIGTSNQTSSNVDVAQGESFWIRLVGQNCAGRDATVNILGQGGLGKFNIKSVPFTFPANVNSGSMSVTITKSDLAGRNTDTNAIFEAITDDGSKVLSSNVLVISKSIGDARSSTPGGGSGGGVPISAQSGQNVVGELNLTNPWSGVTDIFSLLNKVTNFMIQIAIPIAVIFIIYAGIVLLTSAGDTGRIGQAKSMLWYTIIGFSVLLIGKGFFLLVQSILNLGG